MSAGGLARRAPSLVSGWLARASRAGAGASLAALAAAAVESSWARSDGARAPGAMATWVADVGLVAPAALAAAAAVASLLVFLEPTRPRTFRALVAELAPADPAARGRRAAIALVGPVALVVWATASAHLARVVLAAVSVPKQAGALVSLGAVGLAVPVLAASLAALPRLAALGARRTHALGWLVAGLACAGALAAYGVAAGTTGGEGGALAIWGVLKRPELDLRAPALLGACALAAAIGPWLLARIPAALAAALALAPLAATARDARALDAHPALAAALERGAPLGKSVLRALRRATDRDHDGASARFGGGDCDDRDANVFPGAIDVPGDGVDQDCVGGDAPVPPPPEPAAPRASSVRDAIPADLDVILVTVDTLRADLGYAGNPKPLSPNLDELAARSTVFEKAYSLASYTGKSVGPLLIGKYPSETHRNWGHFNTFGKADAIVSERLSAAGVRTMAFQAHWYFAPFTGLSRGFDVWDMSAVPSALGQPDTDTVVTGDKLTRAALRGLSKPENTSGRFFAWIHYVDPHAEYMKHPGAPDLGTGMRAQYDGEVWFVDQQIGELLRFVASQPWGSRTAVVVTSDHGEAFGEHRMIRHGFEIWEELVRVPLLVYVPGAAPRRVAERRSAVDLVPTLLDLFRVDPPSGDAKSDFVSGRSLLDDVLAPPGHEPEKRDVFVDMPAGPNNDERRAFVHDDLKLVLSNGVRWQLFDLAKDPGETEDLWEDEATRARILPRFQAFKSTLREVYVKPVPKD